MKQLICKKNKKIGAITTKVLSFFYNTQKNVYPILYEKMKYIVVVDFPMIGDLVMGLPFYKTLRNNCPQAHITLICQKWAGNLMREQGTVDEIIEFDGRRNLHDPVKLIKHYREFKNAIKLANNRKYDLAIEPRGDIRNIFFMRHIRSKEYVSFNYSGGECLLSRVLIPDESISHAIDDKLNVLEQLGMNVKNEDRIPTLRLPDFIFNEANNYLKKIGVTKDNFLIAINPGASNEIKKWKYFPKLVDRISPELDSKSVILAFGVESDRKTLNDIKNTAEKNGIRAVVVIEELLLYIAILSKCNCMLCNESSAGHLAASFNIPVVVLFGPYEPSFGIPRSNNKVIALSKSFDCKPCFKPNCEFQNRCINAISVDEVEAAFIKICKNLQEKKKE